MGKSLRLNLDLSDFEMRNGPRPEVDVGVLIRSTNDNCCHTVAIKIGHGHGRAKQRPPLRHCAVDGLGNATAPPVEDRDRAGLKQGIYIFTGGANDDIRTAVASEVVRNAKRRAELSKLLPGSWQQRALQAAIAPVEDIGRAAHFLL